MFESEEPFVTLFKFYEYYGLWSSPTPRRRVISIMAFIFLQLLCTLLIILTMFTAITLDVFTRSMIYGSVYVMSTSFVINLIVRKREILELMNDFNEVIYEYPEAKIFMDRGLERSKKLFRCFTLVIVIFVLFGNFINPFFYNSIDIPMIFIAERSFYLAWFFQLLSAYYTFFNLVFIVELKVGFMFMIHSYMEFFKLNLKELKGNGVNGKKELIRCVEMHQNIQR